MKSTPFRLNYAKTSFHAIFQVRVNFSFFHTVFSNLPLVLDSTLLLLDKTLLTDSMRLEGWARLAGSETSVGYSGSPRYCWVRALKSWYKLANKLVRVRSSSFLNWAARKAAISALMSLLRRKSLNSGPFRKMAGEGSGGLKCGTSSFAVTLTRYRVLSVHASRKKKRLWCLRNMYTHKIVWTVNIY